MRRRKDNGGGGVLHLHVSLREVETAEIGPHGCILSSIPRADTHTNHHTHTHTYIQWDHSSMS